MSCRRVVQVALVAWWTLSQAVNGLLVPTARRRPFLCRPLRNSATSGGASEGFHYLASDLKSIDTGMTPPHRFGHNPNSRRNIDESRLKFILNNHSEAAQIRAAEEKLLRNGQDVAASTTRTAQTRPALTPPVLGPPLPTTASAQTNQQQTKSPQQVPPQHVPAPPVETKPEAPTFPFPPAASSSSSHTTQPPSKHWSWTPPQQPLWYDLQSGTQRKAQLHKELTQAHEGVQKYQELVQENQGKFNTTSQDLVHTKEELESCKAQLKESQDTITQLRSTIDTLQKQVHESKSIELEHAKESHRRELEFVRQQGYQSAVNKVKHWGQRITKLENELKILHTQLNGAVLSFEKPPEPIPLEQATHGESSPSQLPQLPQALPWSTMPGARLNRASIVQDTATKARP